MYVEICNILKFGVYRAYIIERDTAIQLNSISEKYTVFK